MNNLFNKIKGKYHDNMITRSYYNSLSIINIERYLQNERNMKLLGEDIANLPDYKYAEAVHKYLKIYDVESDNIDNKRRVGRNNDGGYVMIKPYSEKPIAYSIGIYHDVSWDLDMVNEGYSVFQYDHTINKLPIENKNFHWKKKGLSDKNDDVNNLETLENMLEENGHRDSSGMVLKMDIEGYEWQVLDSLSEECLKKFDQITMEMHGFINYSNREIILRVLEKMSKLFSCVHLHANNYGYVDYCGEYIIPHLLEVTYVNKDKYKLKESKILLPTDLDQPCNDGLPDIILGRWNG